MKTFEYYYNIIYYFFYRGFIKASSGVSIPIFAIYAQIYKIPLIKQRFINKGIDNPLQWHKDRYRKRILENPDRSLATIYGAGFSGSSLAFIFVGFYHILKNFFFPEFEDSFGYILTVTGILASLTHNLFIRQQDQGIRYIKQFNAIKDRWWRIKWSIITALTFPFSIWFMAYTSTKGAIGQFFLHLGGH